MEVAVHIGGALALVTYIFVGAFAGLRQQSVALSADEVDCDYRIAFFHERLLTELDAPPRSSPSDSPESVSDPSLDLQHLLRRTLEICASKRPDLAPRLRVLVQAHDDIVELRQRQAQMRVLIGAHHQGP